MFANDCICTARITTTEFRQNSTRTSEGLLRHGRGTRTSIIPLRAAGQRILGCTLARRPVVFTNIDDIIRVLIVVALARCAPLVPLFFLVQLLVGRTVLSWRPDPSYLRY